MINNKISPNRSVKMALVIRVETTIGKGVEGDPIRPYIEYFTPEGEALLMGDWTQREDLKP